MATLLKPQEISVVHPRPYLPPQAPMSLLALSNELVELVIADIELPEHLLSLAKTCRSLYTLIVPNHLSFRHIDAHVCREEIWEFLAEKPFLAANVRILTLRDNDPHWQERIPKNFKKIPSTNSSKIMNALTRKLVDNQISPFLSALRQMRNLSHLVIRTTPGGRSRQLQRIFNTLDEAHIQLTVFSVKFYFYSNMYPHEKKEDFPMPINQLGYLHSLALAVSYLPDKLYLALANNSATHLSNLYILVEKRWIFGLMNMHWPQLRNFTIIVKPGYIIPENFLRRHANLETLWIGYGTITTLVTPPRLQSLNVSNMFTDHIDLLPNLRHVSEWMQNLERDNSKVKTYCLDSLKDLPLLESCHLPCDFSSENIVLFLNRTPNIKKLNVHLPFPSHCDNLKLANAKQNQEYQKQEAMKAANEFLVHLAKLKRLTHLAGVLVNPHLAITTRRCSPIMEHFATAIPSLLYIQVMHRGKTEWAYIVRDGDGAFMRYTYLKKKFSKNMEKMEWGDFYFGGLKDDVADYF